MDAVPELLGSVLELDEVLAGVGEQGKELAWRSGSGMSLLEGLDGGGDLGVEFDLGCGQGGYSGARLMYRQLQDTVQEVPGICNASNRYCASRLSL